MSKLISTTGGTIPLVDATSEEEFLSFFKFNASLFPIQRFRGWLDHQKPEIKKAAMIYPPTKVYRLVGDNRLCAIAGYKSDGDALVRIVVIVLGDESPQFVDPSQLRDSSAELARVDELSLATHLPISTT